MSRELELLSNYPLIANGFLYIQLCPAHTHAWLTCIWIYIFESYHATTIYYSCVCHNGPDGIPFGLYANLKDLALPIFVHCLRALLDRSSEAPPGFNHVFLMGLPEKPGAEMGNGVCAYWPGDTRPLSTCGCFKPNPHRLRHICDAQRGFLKDRHLLQNMVKLDHCALRSFSLSGLFHWTRFVIGGWFPEEVLHATRCLYQDNWLKPHGKSFPSIRLRSGARQGCPLSPQLFALATDSLLCKLQSVMPSELGIVRAFADDIAAMCSDWCNLSLSWVFVEFEETSALSLNMNIPKTVLFTCIYIHMYLQKPSLGCKCAKRCPRTLPCLEGGL